MKCDLIEESADRGPRGDGLRKPGLAGIIRRNLRNASMQCVNGRCLQPKSVFQNMAIGLESVKKTLQVAGVGTGAIRIGCSSPGTT